PDAAVVAVHQAAGSIEGEGVVVGVDGEAVGPGLDVRPGVAPVGALDEPWRAAVGAAAGVDDAGVVGVDGQGVVVPALAEAHVIGRVGQLVPGGPAVGGFYHLQERPTGAGDPGVESLRRGRGQGQGDAPQAGTAGRVARRLPGDPAV